MALNLTNVQGSQVQQQTVAPQMNVDTSVGDAIRAVGQVANLGFAAYNMHQQNKAEQAGDQLEDELNQLTEDARLAAEGFNVEGLPDAALTEANKDFQKLAQAAKQGKLSGDVKVRSEAILKRHIDANPQAADQLRKIASDTVGFDPIGQFAQQNIAAIEAVEAEQAQLQADEQIAGITGESVQEVRNTRLIKEHRAAQAAVHANEVALGIAPIQSVQQNVMGGVNVRLGETINELVLQAQSGAQLDASVIRGRLMSEQLAVQNEAVQLLQQSGGYNDPAIVKQVQSDIAAAYQNALTFVTELDAEGRSQRDLNLIKTFINTEGLMAFPDIAAAEQISPAFAADYISIKKKVSENPEYAKLLSPETVRLMGSVEGLQQEISKFVGWKQGTSTETDVTPATVNLATAEIQTTAKPDEFNSLLQKLADTASYPSIDNATATGPVGFSRADAATRSAVSSNWQRNWDTVSKQITTDIEEGWTPVFDTVNYKNGRWVMAKTKSGRHPDRFALTQVTTKTKDLPEFNSLVRFAESEGWGSLVSTTPQQMIIEARAGFDESQVTDPNALFEGTGFISPAVADARDAARTQGVDLSTFADGTYQDASGNIITIKSGQIVGVGDGN